MIFRISLFSYKKRTDEKYFYNNISFLIGTLTIQCSDKVKNIINDEEVSVIAEYFVENEQQLTAVLPVLRAGDQVIIKNGVWSNVELLFSGVGTSKKPIIFRAETIGEVILSGDSRVKISGDYVVVSGLSFKNGANTKGAEIEFKNGAHNARHSRLTNTSIKDYSPADKSVDTKWISRYGYHNQIDHCSFEGKTNLGTTLVVWKTHESDHHEISYNYFGKRPDLGQNGGETIRIGTSDWSLYPSHTIVEHNLFEECDGEIEIISNKSCNNIYRYNTFLNCNGTLTLRHGNDCEVHSNFLLIK